MVSVSLGVFSHNLRLIYDSGGFALIFETQIYEVSQGKLVKKIQDILGLPVICSKAIPDGIIDRFENWHIRKNTLIFFKIHMRENLTCWTRKR